MVTRVSVLFCSKEQAVFNICTRPRSIAAASVLCLILLFQPGAVRAEEDPSISLVKTLVVREVNGRQVSTEEYMVRKGDSVARLLIGRGVTGPGKIPGELLKVVLALNPGMRDPNLIFEGQKLILPTGPVEGPPWESEMDDGPAAEKPAAAAEQPGEQPAPDKQEASTAPPPQPRREEAKAPSTEKFKTVTLKSGESLAQLLRNEGVPESLIFNEYLHLLIKMNPQISNPNVVYSGQQVRVPLNADWAEAVLSEESQPDRKPAPGPKTSPVMARVPAAALLSAPPVKPQSIVPPPQLPPARSVAARTALGLIFTRIGEHVITKGQHFLPLKTGGQITINTQSFPIIELQGGQRIVLDLDRRLPQNMVELIRANWSNYTVFRPENEKTLAQMLGRLLDLGQYYKVKNDGTPWVLAGPAHISLGADWIVWPTQDDWAHRRAVAINMPETADLGVSPPAAAFLEKAGIRIIDFHPQGNLIGPEPWGGSTTPRGEVTDLQAEDVQKLTQALLELLGQKYEPHLSIPLMESNSSSQDFVLTVEAPIYFSRGGKNFVVDLDGAPKEVKELLRKSKFEVISRAPGEGPEILIRRLLKAMGVSTEEGLTIKASRRPAPRDIAITFSGLVFSTGGRRIFLTRKQEEPGLELLLAQPGLKVVQYSLVNPT
ncbi:MAG: LysM peptidoglycan-binding domain-containing protein [Pseudomonadota bacterium]